MGLVDRCNKGMKERHWRQISDIVGFDLQPDDRTSLSRVLDMGVENFIDQVTALCWA